MKTCLRILGLLAVLVAGEAFARQELAGIWQGKLAVDAQTSLTIQFTFTKRPDGTYSAVLNSPDNGGIKNVAASAVSWDASALKVQVPSLSGAYAGTFKDGRFEGQWTQQGQALPLALGPYQKPQLSKAAIDTLSGSWHGPVTIPGGTLTFVFRFKPNDKGELQGSLAVPERGGVETPISDIEFADGRLALKVPRVQGDYTASYANGALTGTWKQGSGPGLPVAVKKGDYAAPVHALALNMESFAPLAGKWQGKLGPLPGPNGPVNLNLVLRFEMNGNGQVIGFIDSPDQKVMGIPVIEASLAAGKLAVKVGAVQAEYRGDLSGKTLTGQWTQGGKSNPLTFTKQ